MNFKESPLDNTASCCLSEKNLLKAMEQMKTFKDEDSMPLSVSGWSSPIHEFIKWLCQQEDVPEEIKLKSQILFQFPLPKYIADEFQPYLDKYNKEIC